MNIYRVKRPGDVLNLHVDLPDCMAGCYILLSLSDTCRLSRLGENEAGNLCATPWIAEVSLADLSLFVNTGLSLELPGDGFLGCTPPATSESAPKMQEPDISGAQLPGGGGHLRKRRVWQRRKRHIRVGISDNVRKHNRPSGDQK